MSCIKARLRANTALTDSVLARPLSAGNMGKKANQGKEMKADHKILMILILLIWKLINIDTAIADDEYIYQIRKGDTLRQIALLFTGNESTDEIARANGIININSIEEGTHLKLPSIHPVNTLVKYLSSIYNHDLTYAYSLLSEESQMHCSLQYFKNSCNEMAFFDLNSLKICADSIENNTRYIAVKVNMEEDPASWAFNLVYERNGWYIYLEHTNPTFPYNSRTLKCSDSRYAATIQVFATSSATKAATIVQDLVRLGFPAYHTPIEQNRKTLYRIRIGTFKTRHEARAFLQRTRSKFPKFAQDGIIVDEQ